MLRTPDGYRFGLSSDTSIGILTKAQLQGLRPSIERASDAENDVD